MDNILEHWTQIRDASLSVVLLTQRQDGLWTLPAVEPERVQTFSSMGSADDQKRSEGFGFGSITNTLHALLGLQSATEQIPQTIVAEALRAIARHRSDEGAYGTPLPALHGMPDWYRSARHTATGMITALLFEDRRPAADLERSLRESADWLIEQRGTAPTWLYNTSNHTKETGFMSTAAAICALTMFARRFERPGNPDEELGNSLVKALGALSETMKCGAWIGDNIPTCHQVRDSAFSLRLLALAFLDRPESWGTDFDARILEMSEAFLGASVSTGWPAQIGDSSVHLAASIEGACLCSVLEQKSERAAAQLAETKQFILSKWDDPEEWNDLTGWDWQSLTFLSGRIAGPATRKDVAALQAASRTAHTHAEQKTLSSKDLENFHPNTRPGIEFALSEGQGLQGLAAVPKEPDRDRRNWAETAYSRLTSLPAKIITPLIAFVGVIAAFSPNLLPQFVAEIVERLTPAGLVSGCLALALLYLLILWRLSVSAKAPPRGGFRRPDR